MRRNARGGPHIAAAALFLAAAVGLTLAPLTAGAAVGCCVVLQPGKTDASVAESVKYCLPFPNIGACKTYQGSSSFPTVWRDPACSKVQSCAGRAPGGCCKMKSGGSLTACVPAEDNAACNIFIKDIKDQRLKEGKDPYAVNADWVSGQCTAQADCGNKTIDKALYDVQASAGTVAEEPQVREIRPIAPLLQIPIPGLRPFTTDIGSYKSGYAIPWIGQYVNAIYSWALGIVATLAVSMIVWGGVKWVTAGGIPANAESGKKTIQNAIIGLFLALGSYLILYTLNPALTRFEALQIGGVGRITYGRSGPTESVPAKTAKEMAGQAPSPQLTSKASVVQSPGDFRDDEPPPPPETVTPPPASSLPTPGAIPAPVIEPHSGDMTAEEMTAIKEYARKVAEQWQIPPCYLYATFPEESRWKPWAVGHDENFNTFLGRLVTKRLNFLRSGRTFKKKPIPVSVPPDCSKTKVSEEVYEQCKKGHNAKFLNDDTPVTSEAPDFGIDWRYSHGIGLGQSTIFGEKCSNGVHGITYHGRCFTPPELITVEGGVEATIREFMDIFATYKMDTLEKRQNANAQTLASVFAGYIGGKASDSPSTNRAARYLSCVKNGDNHF